MVKAKLRFGPLGFSLSDEDEASPYQDLLDVFNSGERPPEDERKPSMAELEPVIGELTEGLFGARK